MITNVYLKPLVWIENDVNQFVSKPLGETLELWVREFVNNDNNKTEQSWLTVKSNGTILVHKKYIGDIKRARKEAVIFAEEFIKTLLNRIQPILDYPKVDFK